MEIQLHQILPLNVPRIRVSFISVNSCGFRSGGSRGGFCLDYCSQSSSWMNRSTLRSFTQSGQYIWPLLLKTWALFYLCHGWDWFLPRLQSRRHEGGDSSWVSRILSSQHSCVEWLVLQLIQSFLEDMVHLGLPFSSVEVDPVGCKSGLTQSSLFMFQVHQYQLFSIATCQMTY